MLLENVVLNCLRPMLKRWAQGMKPSQPGSR